MHHVYSICLLLLLNGCSSVRSSASNPMQNGQLNAISPSGKPVKNKGYLQQSYETWEKEEWEPMTEKRPSLEEKEFPATPTAAAETKKGADDDNIPAEVNASKTFTLQYYFDEWERYLDEKEKQNTGPSHQERIDTMPVIGNE